MNRTLRKLEDGKLYYSISEVCRMAGLEPHVLRYWETEFPQMRPRKNRAGNRAYRAKEIQYVHYIRFLLHDEKYTIQGAKKRLAEVTPDEVAGQVSLIRNSMFTRPAPASPSPFSAPSPAALEPAPGDPQAGAEDGAKLRGELAAIRTELRSILLLFGKEG